MTDSEPSISFAYIAISDALYIRDNIFPNVVYLQIRHEFHGGHS